LAFFVSRGGEDDDDFRFLSSKRNKQAPADCSNQPPSACGVLSSEADSTCRNRSPCTNDQPYYGSPSPLLWPDHIGKPFACEGVFNIPAPLPPTCHALLTLTRTRRAATPSTFITRHLHPTPAISVLTSLNSPLRLLSPMSACNASILNQTDLMSEKCGSGQAGPLLKRPKVSSPFRIGARIPIFGAPSQDLCWPASIKSLATYAFSDSLWACAVRCNDV